MSVLKLLYITNKPDVALIAEKNGVDRIWIDLEKEGKEERQKGRNTVKSNHSIDDIKKIKPLLTKAELIVRINPWSNRSINEIDSVIEAGADIIMLPMWKTVEEVQQFIKAVNGRCKTNLLLETIGAEKNIENVIKIDGIDEFHIGLNDLHLEYKLPYMMQLLSNGKIEEICNKIRPSGITFGFGGIGMIGSGLIPSPEEIINEHFRLGSTALILSRSFCNQEKITDLNELDAIFNKGVKAIRKQEQIALNMSEKELLQNKKIVDKGVEITLRNFK